MHCNFIQNQDYAGGKTTEEKSMKKTTLKLGMKTRFKSK